MANVGIVLLFVAFYFRFLKRRFTRDELKSSGA